LETPIRYDDITLAAGLRLDLLIAERVVVEVKSVERLLPIHEAQLLTYLRCSRKRLGLLLNFNVRHFREGVRRKVL
jgi:GxxExxY protein